MEPKAGILVVDDDPGTCKTLSDIFEDEGYRVAAANTGRQAADKVKQTAFDAALIDIRLPDTDGIALLQEFKKSYPEMVCVIITGHAVLENAIEALEHGADGYFTKPLVLKEVIYRVEQVLDRQRLQRELRKSEKKIRILFDYASDAIFIYDPKGRFLEVNRTACECLDYSREELLQMAPMDIETPEYAVLEPKRIEELKSKEHVFFETVYVTRHGKLIPIELSSRIIDFEKKLAILNIARDITERKQMEKKLQDTLKDLRKVLRGTIQAMALTVETRDPYTAGHQRRVADLARAIAKEMGFSRNKVAGIRMAGVIHDIGKIAIPSEILSKPGRLSKAEFELIKNHPQVGYDILKPIKFPWPVAQIVLQHHERMDGSGYPQGLSGEDILPEARILGVADVVEAMASHRPYRAALGIDKALEEISNNRGKLYDVEVVNACLRVFKENGFKFKI